MVSIPSVGVVLNWRNEKNKSGLYPVHIRAMETVVRSVRCSAFSMFTLFVSYFI